jgi:putative flippase GtrA
MGFIVDTSVLYMLKGFFGLYVARLFSFVLAAIATWVFNRSITFGTRMSNRPIRTELLVYLSLMLFGGIINYAVYAFLVYRNALVFMYPVLGVAAGALAGMSVNFVLSRFVLFRFPQDLQDNHTHTVATRMKNRN